MPFRLFTIVLLSNLLLLFPTYSQEYSGIVKNSETNRGLEKVNIYNTRTGSGSSSDDLGIFHLKRNIKNSDTIRFSSIGFETRSFNLRNLKNIGFEVFLTPNVDNLETVSVEKRRLTAQLPFEKLEGMPKGLFGFSANIYNDKLYVIGGNAAEQNERTKELLDRYSDQGFEEFMKALARTPSMNFPHFNSKLYIYDFSQKIWNESSISTIPRIYHSSEVIGDKIYVIGGKTLSKNWRKEYLPNQVEIYDIQKGTLLVDETNPHMAVNFASFSLDSLIFAAGGSIKKYEKTDRKDYTNKFHVFNTKSGYWQELGAMPEAKESSGILVNDIFYFIGGFNKEPLSTIETYNLKNGKWKRIGELFESMERPAIAKKGGVIYIYTPKKLLSLDTQNYILKEYKIDTDQYEATLENYEDKLYILGGFRVSEFTISPSNNFFEITISDLENTKVQRQKKLKM